MISWLYEQEAEAGNAEMMLLASQMLLNGYGCEQDKIRGQMMRKLASSLTASHIQ
jgi:hypothetical protein